MWYKGGGCIWLYVGGWVRTYGTCWFLGKGRTGRDCAISGYSQGVSSVIPYRVSFCLITLCRADAMNSPNIVHIKGQSKTLLLVLARQ